MAVYFALGVGVYPRKSLNEEWRRQGLAGFDARERDHCLGRRITDLETNAQRRCEKVIDGASVEQTEGRWNIMPVSVWERLRSVFVHRLICYELQRQCDRGGSSPPVDYLNLERLVMDMLTTESRFGGVFEEELVRVLRAVYPHIARQLLPSTPMERIQELAGALGNQISHISEVFLSADDKPQAFEGVPTRGSTYHNLSSYSALDSRTLTLLAMESMSESTYEPLFRPASLENDGYSSLNLRWEPYGLSW